MDLEDKFAEKLLEKSKPAACESCGGKMAYKGGGTYKCESCDAIAYDDYGKVKKYLDEHGPTPAIYIARATGVNKDLIEMFLKQGKLEIPEGSKFYIRCEKCGCSLKSGRYCEECAKALKSGNKRVTAHDIGERPKYHAAPSNSTGKMRFSDKK